jgi:hypothetical protein
MAFAYGEPMRLPVALARRNLSTLLLASLSLGLPACAPQRPPSPIASSAGEAGYAVRYPDELEQMTRRLDERQQAAKKLSAGFAAYPDQLKDAKKDRVLAIIERAGEAGRSYAYVDRVQEAEQVHEFFRDEKDEINKKVGGAVQYAAKQKGANLDAYGVTGHALEEAIDKQLEKRIRERSEAQTLIDRERVSLGKPNAAALEKQADEISQSSYIVHVESVTQRQLLDGMIQEAPAVKKTAERAIEREKAYQAEAGRTAPEKKASDERIAAMTRSKDRIDEVVEKARQSLPAIDQQIKEGQKTYADALKALKDRFR